MSVFLDVTCEQLNSFWETKQSDIIEKVESFSEAMKAAELIFGEGNVGKKWTTNGFERRLNRAVLDAILFYFSNQHIRQSAIEYKSDVLDAFKNLCTTSTDFRNAIEVTTKSMKATHDRLYLWGQILRDTLPINFEIPVFDLAKNRITFSDF